MREDFHPVMIGSPIVRTSSQVADLGAAYVLAPVTRSTSDRGNVYGGIIVDIEAKGSKFP